MQSGFFWYELMTTDVAAARAFYSEVFGWLPRGWVNETMIGSDYYSWGLDGHQKDVAGLMELPEMARQSGARPVWSGYVRVADADLTLAQLVELGGEVHVGPTTIDGIGRMAMVSDPHGAHFYIEAPMIGDSGTIPTIPLTAIGNFGWNELYAGDQQAAFDFYSRLFGWSAELSVDMGKMGTYQCFGVGGQAIGGIMTITADIPMACWNFYVNVEAIEPILDRVRARGGQIINGPHQVPVGAYIATCLDPQGAMFSITSAHLN